MNTGPTPSQVCIGLSIEGDTLRLASVGRDGKNLRILDLASMTVPVMQHVTHDGDDTGGGSNPFEKIELSDTDAVDHSAVKDFISGHYVPGASLAVSLGDHNIRTFLLPAVDKENPSKALTRILGEIQHSLNIELSKDQVAYQRIGKSTLLVTARIEGTPLLEIFAMPHDASRRSTRINFVTSNDVALINLVRSHFRFRDDSISHIIHVGKDETRLYIMRGYDLVYLAPPVQQGANDREYVTMLNNRLELAAENAGFPKADTVVLSGYAEEIGLKEEILENNPQIVFHSLSKLRMTHGANEALAREIRHYPIPLSVAWEKLDPKNPHFYHINLIPHRIREDQKKLKLAWHGLLLLALLFISAAGLTFLGLQKQEEIRTLSAKLAFERKQVNEQRAIVSQINELENRSAAIIDATNTLDTLLMNSEKYSTTLDTIARAAGALQNMWINEMKPDADGGIAFNGFSTTRASVPSFSQLIGQTNMREISVQEIGERKVFRFDVGLTVPDLYPGSGSPASVWHDTITATLGDVATRFGSASADTEKKLGTKSKKKKGAK